MSITITGDVASIVFDRYGLPEYDLFLKVKTLPESQIGYDWEADRYTVTTPARFIDRLGMAAPARTITPLPIAGHLFDYQRWVLDMALEAKRFAAWLDTGLGKSAVLLEWSRQVKGLTDRPTLILAPLQVIPQIIEMWSGWYPDEPVPAALASRDDLIRFCKGDPAIGITNYEKFISGTVSELRLLGGIAADESSILRTGGGTIKWNVIKSARGIEYKLSCTATPAPNEAMEYASQAAFLEKLRSEGDILWTYFQRDKRGEWTVKPHAKAAFYQFMSTWSVYMRDPARFGFRDVLADLPDPEIIETPIKITPAQQLMLSETLTTHSVGLWADDRVPMTVRQKLLQIARGFRYVGTGKERRIERVDSCKVRHVVETAREEVAAGRQVLIWTTFDEEAAILSDELQPVGRSVTPPIGHGILTGSMSVEDRVTLLERFRAGEFPVLISKPQLIGYGLNLQHVTAMIFSGFDDSFERMYQAVRRAYRYGQTETVRVHLPYVPELERMVYENVRQKEIRFLEEVAAQEQQYRVALGIEAA